MPVKKKTFDVELFRKFIRLLDSNREGERDMAFLQSLKLCAECDPPMLFCEAVGQAFGHSDDSAVAEIAELQDRLSQREHEAAELADAYTEAQQRIDALEQGQGPVEGEERHRFYRLRAQAWRFPQTRLLLLVAVIMLRMVIRLHLDHGATNFAFWVANIVTLAWALPLFCKWTQLQFEKYGLLQLLVKWSILGVGLILTAYLFFGIWPWEGVLSIAFWRVVPVKSSDLAFTCLAVTAVLTVSRLSNWLTGTIGMKLWESNPAHMLRNCF